MVQPNQRVYTTYYVTVEGYEIWEPHIHELEKRTKTEIKFNFEEQCFVIKGRSQGSVDGAMEKIVSRMLPELCKEIDDKLMIGTYEDPLLSQEIPSPSQSRISTASSPVVGRAPILDDDREKKPKKEESGSYYYNETESDGSDDDEEEFVETFTFAKNVRNPMDILTVPSIGGKKPVDYLSVIGNDTDTECSLIDKKVNIVGSNEASVKEALQRFKNLQTIFKRSKRSTAVVSCIHMQSESHFGLYFCHLDRFAYKNYVDVLSMKNAPFYVLLPVFKDQRGGYQKPKDLLDLATNVPPVNYIQSSSVQRQQQQQRQKEQEMSLEERMRQATFQTSFSNTQNGMAPDQRPLWGENKNYIPKPSMQKPPPTSNIAVASSPRVPATPIDDFPELPSTPKKVPGKKEKQQRVIRIGLQKSGCGSPAINNYVESLRKYNFHLMRTNLAEGLESVRGYKGGIKLSASMGKILWTRLQPDTQKKVWTYEQMNDILIKEKGIQPYFNGLVTKDKDIMTKITEVCPQSHGIYAYFEVHARARNQPILPYKPVVLHMSQQAVDFKKIVVATNKVTEVNWITLDRKFDFQLNLRTEELTRTDVKPYSTFLKKISISPHTRQLTYEDVPDFLTVDKIYLKNTTKIRLHFPFVVEITRVEELPLISQTSLGSNINKILGDTGNGKIWYTVEIFFSAHDEDFKRNSDLPAGKLASWTVDDILGSVDDHSGPLIQFVRCLLMFTEKTEETF